MVLLAYFWMLLPDTGLPSGQYMILAALFGLVQSPVHLPSGSLSSLLLPSSLLFFFGFFLWLTILIVVHLVNLSEGSFT